jgi:hypothetical protein
LPIKVYNHQEQRIEFHEESDLPALLSTGVYTLEKGATLDVMAPDGRVGSVPGEQALAAFQEGFQPMNADQVHSWDLEQKYGGFGWGVAAAGLGALKGATFGLSTPILKAMGVPKETMRDLQAVRSTEALGGEIGTIALTTLLGGGAGAAKLGRAGKLLGATPPARVARMGLGVEQAVAGAIPGRLGRVVGAGAGGALEGGLYGAGHFVSEASLGNVEETAEALIGHIGAGAIFGGAAAGGLRASGEIISGAFRGSKHAAKLLKDTFRRETGVEPHPKLLDGVEDSKWWAKWMAALTGGDHKDAARIQKLWKDRWKRARATEDPQKYRDLMAQEMASLTQKTDDILNTFGKESQGISKNAWINAAAKEADPQAVFAKFDEMMGLGEKEGSIIQALREIGETFPGAKLGSGGTDSLLAQALKVRQEVHALLGGISQRSGGSVRSAFSKKSAGEVFNLLDDFKQHVQVGLTKIRKLDASVVQHAGPLHEAYMTRLFGPFKEGLENVGIWGKTAAGYQAKSNAVIEEFLRHAPRKDDFKLWSVYHQTIGKELDDTITREAAAGGWLDFINQFGTASKSEAQKAHILSQAQKAQKMMDTIAKLRGSSKLKKLATQHRARLSTLEKRMARIDDVVKHQNQQAYLASKVKGGLVGGMLVGGFGGYLLFGQEGILIGLALSPFTKPGNIIQSIGTLSRMKDMFRGSMSRNLGKYLRNVKSGKALRRVAPPAATIFQRENWGDKRTKDKDRYEGYFRRLKELEQVVNSQEMMTDRIAKNTTVIAHHAPETAQAVAEKTVQIATNIWDNMPKPPVTSSLLARRWKPSVVDMRKAEEYAFGALKPGELMKRLGETGTVNPIALRAFKENHPVEYQALQIHAAQKIQEDPDAYAKAPRKHRDLLSNFLGVALDDTFQPRTLASMASVHMREAMQLASARDAARRQTSQSPSGAFQKMSIDEQAQTDAQRLS